MSHFTVLVTKTNQRSHETQLERFYEQGEEDDYFMEKQIVVAHDGYDQYLKKTVEEDTDYADNYRLKDDHGNAAIWDEYAAEAQAALDSDDEEVKRAYIAKHEGEMDEGGNFYYIRNPEAKWDWYQVGGRWSGYFTPKKNSESGKLGEPDWQTRIRIAAGVDELPEGVDVIKVKDIDWDTMEARERKRRGDYFDEEMKNPEERRFIWDREKPTDREAYVNAPVSHSTFAVLHDDTWYEKGEMGWWATVSNEKDQADWDTEFRKLIESLDPDDEVTIVDCHI